MFRDFVVSWQSEPADATEAPSSAANEVHDFDLVAFAHERAVEGSPFDDDRVVLDRDAARIDVELGQQAAHGDRTGQLERVAIQRNDQIAAA
jgi:hypothetical protein